MHAGTSCLALNREGSSEEDVLFTLRKRNSYIYIFFLRDNLCYFSCLNTRQNKMQKKTRFDTYIRTTYNATEKITVKGTLRENEKIKNTSCFRCCINYSYSVTTKES